MFVGEALLVNCWSTVNVTINDTSESTIGSRERSRQNEWFDEEFSASLKENSDAQAIMMQQETRQNAERYRQKRKHQTRLFRKKKCRLEEAECEEIELLCRFQETRRFYQKLIASRNDGREHIDGRTEVIERWKQHIDEHLNSVKNVGARDQDNEVNDYASAAEDGSDPNPTLREVKHAIHQLKTNKSAVKDGIVDKLIQLSLEKLYNLPAPDDCHALGN